MTSAEYVLIDYVPDPYTEGRVVIGALVRVEDVVRLVRGKPPCEHCLGASGARLVEIALEDVERRLTSGWNTLTLPGSVGPQIFVRELRSVPEGVADAPAWVWRGFSAAGASSWSRSEPSRERCRTGGAGRHRSYGGRV
jgi:hypothetical protein